jgi:hypothetical protein
MKIRTTFALAVAVLTIGVPAAAAEPDGYQPQLKTGVETDAIDRYLQNRAPEAQPDAIDRYLQNNSTSAASAVETTGAAGHPDSRAVRPGPTSEPTPVAADARDWTPGVVGALSGALLALLAVVGASAIRERRRLVLR